MEKSDIIIIGAGAAGLIAARELAKAGKKVIVLEARERIGGRIWPLPEKDWGSAAQAGAEFVHGSAPVTKSLIREAGLTFIPAEGEMWNIGDSGPIEILELIPDKAIVSKKLRELKDDMPIAIFLEKYFGEEKYARLRNSVIRMVEGYDAADPYQISAFSLRDEWLGGEELQHGKIKEGYGALLNFLESDCKKHGVSIYLDHEVESVEASKKQVSVRCANGEKYNAQKIVVTASLPTINRIHFNPPLPEKMAAASKIGFGSVIKILLLFKNPWWADALGKDLSKMRLLFSNEKVAIWWTRYPEAYPLLTGWIAGPAAEKLKSTSSDEILDMALVSLSNIFKVKKEWLVNKLINSKVINWPADPFAEGAYSYSTVDTKNSYEELARPVNNTIFFAGEALFSGKETATVEGALASGLETVRKIVNIN